MNLKICQDCGLDDIESCVPFVAFDLCEDCDEIRRAHETSPAAIGVGLLIAAALSLALWTLGVLALRNLVQ